MIPPLSGNDKGRAQASARQTVRWIAAVYTGGGSDRQAGLARPSPSKRRISNSKSMRLDRNNDARFDSMIFTWSAELADTRLRFAALAAMCGIALAATSPARAENFSVRYSLKLIGVPLGTATVSGAVSPIDYRIQASAKLTGVATVVSNARGAATASGAISQGRVLSNGFATTSANSQQTRTIRIAMAAGNVRASEIVPPFTSKPDRVPVTEAHKRNVVDPLSGLMMPIVAGPAPIGPGACDRVVPVFDGWTRFNITLSYRGTRPSDLPGYSGPVVVCGARYAPISGHLPRPIIQQMADNKDIEVWLAPIGQSNVAVPIRLAMATAFGRLTIEAQDFSATEKAAGR